MGNLSSWVLQGILQVNSVITRTLDDNLTESENDSDRETTTRQLKYCNTAPVLSPHNMAPWVPRLHLFEIDDQPWYMTFSELSLTPVHTHPHACLPPETIQLTPSQVPSLVPRQGPGRPHPDVELKDLLHPASLPGPHSLPPARGPPRRQASGPRLRRLLRRRRRAHAEHREAHQQVHQAAAGPVVGEAK